jgi:ectoine hydroxylase-related dioxygenase (phytanoyl-CoA dioxygenase family)
LNCQIITPLSVFNNKNGATAFLPYSHKLNKYPNASSHKKNKFLQIRVNQGSLLIFNGLIWHYAAHNRSRNLKRYALVAQYIPEYITLLLDLKIVTKKKILKSNPSLCDLLGLNLEFPSVRF